MLLSINWLREFVPYQGTAQELGAALTMLGLELEGIHTPFTHLQGIVVGHVLSCEKHPDADTLSVTRVDVGTEQLDIVCGAPNVAAGQKVAVAPVGYTMPSGLTIKKAKLRGLPSHGMICSEAELELSDDHEGIWVLPASCKPGQGLIEALNLDTEICDIGITPNRGDCLSVLGLAREVALAFSLPLTLPQVKLEESFAAVDETIPIEIADPSLCPLYKGRILKGAKIGKSPDWLRLRLFAVGLRPISNIVDVSNYIMLELGQPLHAFDMDCLADARIIVRTASEGEKMLTLDGQERTLHAGDITIRDAEKAVALAGVMGGLNSEITDATQNIFLESAIFNPVNIRRTARRLGLSSDASYRFERGVDQNNATYSMDRAMQLMQQVAGGTVVRSESGSEAKAWQAPGISFRPERVSTLLGVNITQEFCSNTLETLGCTVDKKGTPWQVCPASWRHDLTREVDLIEEILRVHGVDKIPLTLPTAQRSLDRASAPLSRYSFWRKIRHWGAGVGLNEVINYSFFSHKDLDNFGLPKDERIAIMNPLSQDQEVLRTALAPGLLHCLRTNISHGHTGLHFMELAAIFHADASSETTAQETGCLGIVLYGNRHDSHWPHDDALHDYLDCKGYVSHLLQQLGLGEAEYSIQKDHTWLLPCVAVSVAGKSIGVLGRVQPQLADSYHARHDVWVAELNLDTLQELYAATQRYFTALPVYPPVRRDITVQAPLTLTAETILQAIRATKQALQESVELIDCFEPAESKTRNLTFRITYRHAQRTLKDAEVDKERDAVAKYLPTVLPVTI